MAGQPDIFQLSIAQPGENFSGTCPHTLPLPVAIGNDKDRFNQTPTERFCCSVFVKFHRLPLNTPVYEHYFVASGINDTDAEILFY